MLAYKNRQAGLDVAEQLEHLGDLLDHRVGLPMKARVSPGPLNAITDVEGIRVGHVWLVAGAGVCWT